MSALFRDLNCVFDYHQGVISRNGIKYDERNPLLERLKNDIESVFTYNGFNVDEWSLLYKENENPIYFSIHYVENGMEDFYDNFLQFKGATE